MMSASFSATKTRMAVLSVLFLSILIIGCNSSKKAYNRGDYDKAVQLSIDKLRSKPGNKSAREILSKAWPRAIAFHEDRITLYKATNDRFKWEKIVDSYEQLNRMASLAQRCPACDDVIDTRRLFIDELNDARPLAAEARYQAGLESLRSRNRESAREAVEHFMVVERMFSDYMDTRDKMSEALSYATIHVVVSVPPIQSRSLSLSHEFFHNKVMEYLSTNRRMNEFVRFYYPHEAEAEGIDNPDHQVWLQFDDFVVGQTLMETNTETVMSKDSVKVGETTLPGGKVDVFNRVEARYTLHRKTLVSAGLLDMQIVDAWTGRTILQEKIPGEFIWINEWASFNGDERALTSAQKKLTGNGELTPPAPQELFISFTEPIYDKVTDRLRRFYSGL